MAAFRFLVDARGSEAQKKQVISNIVHIVTAILGGCVALFLVVNAFVHVPYADLVLLLVCVTAFSNLLLQFARGLGDNKKFAIACTVTSLVTLAATIALLVYAHMGAQGMLLAIALGNVAGAIYLFFSLKFYRYIGFTNHDVRLQKKLLAYSAPLVPNGISWWVINVSDRTIISMLISVAANGIYAVANKYAAIFTSLFAIFGMSWTESASVHINDKDRDAFFSDTINASVRLFGTLGLVLIAAIPWAFPLLVNTTYNEAYMYIPILIIAAFFNALVGMYSAIYVAKKMTKQVAITSIMAAAINITLNLLLITFIGLYAAAFATVFAYLAMAVYRHYALKKYVAITYKKNIFVLLAVLYCGAIALYYLNNPFGNIVSVLVIAAAAYLLNKSVASALKNKVFRYASRGKVT
jgi:O-antigen/teichoic acid export membrane protein